MVQIGAESVRLTAIDLRRSYLYVLSVCYSVFFLSSCIHNKKQKLPDLSNANPPLPMVETVQKGKVLENVISSADPLTGYSLYIPSTYKENDPFPLIVFFDPHAKGKVPVKKYSRLAEKYGFILAGSNNSKNGMAVEECASFFDKILNDVTLHYSINKLRIAVAGFSGGARVASYVGFSTTGVSAVFSCGGGLPDRGIANPVNSKFSWIAFGGVEDFNLIELRSLPCDLLIEFSGKHEWPSDSVFEDAFILSTLTQHAKQYDTVLVHRFVYHNDSLINHYLTVKELLRASAICQKVLYFTKDISEKPKLNTNCVTISYNDEYRKQANALDKLSEKEKVIKEQFAGILANSSAPLYGLQTEIADLYKKSGSTDRNEALMYKRVLNFLSLVCYSYASSMLQGNNLSRCDYYNQLYRLVDPSNPEHEYIAAQLSIKQGDSSAAMNFLKEAAKLGFDDSERLYSDPVFEPLRNLEDFRSVLDQVQRNGNTGE